MKRTFQCLLLAAAVAAMMVACRPVSDGIIKVVSEKVTVDTIAQPEVMRAIDVSIDLRKLHSDSLNRTLLLPLPGEKPIRLIRKRIDPFVEGRFAWFGIAEKDPGSFVLISVTKNAVSGRITLSGGRIFVISAVDKERYRISELDPRKFRETPDDFILPDIQPGPEAPSDCPDPPNRIDVMVVYTADAETGAGGADGMIALIYESIYLSNLAYQNSNINQRLNLVHYEEVTYTETGNGNTDITRLQNGSDGFMDNVPTLRDTYGADLVCLLVETMNANGIAYVMGTVSNAFAPYGYSVVRRQNSAASLTFPHELGHNMGARHDCANDNTLGSPYDYNHGFFEASPADGGDSWRTVMAYNSCGSGPCTRIPWFSNPNLVYSPTGSNTLTDPMGTAAVAGTCTADNHLTLNNTAATVANFRCSSPGVSNVWMRDSWNDTGAEPDPNTAGEDMWRSPYIWVRTSQDAAFLHQHQHEDPIEGQDNWLYVKVINGGTTAANGHLEVYYANASVSLTWPGGWTLIDDPVVNLPAGSAQVVEVKWSGLPGAGHYCLVARWNSAADPMTFAETSNIGSNVRQNNNLVWRNVNIVPLSPDMDQIEAVFEMLNPGGEPTMLKFTDEALFPKHLFMETGTIWIIPEKPLYDRWVKGGSKGHGIVDEKGRLRITARTATMENILMGRKDRAAVKIVFERKKETLPDLYLFNVSQFVPGTDQERKTAWRAVGGVTYEIYTYKR